MVSVDLVVDHSLHLFYLLAVHPLYPSLFTFLFSEFLLLFLLFLGKLLADPLLFLHSLLFIVFLKPSLW